MSALDGIRRRMISVMNPEASRPQATLVRAVNFEQRLGFGFDEATLDYIGRNYRPSLDPAIREYVSYKRMPAGAYEKVVGRLRELCAGAFNI